MSNKSVEKREKTLHERVSEFMNSPEWPDNLRRNAAKSYHPDNFHTPAEKQDAHEIMSGINATVDKIKKKKHSQRENDDFWEWD